MNPDHRFEIYNGMSYPARTVNILNHRPITLVDSKSKYDFKVRFNTGLGSFEEIMTEEDFARLLEAVHKLKDKVHNVTDWIMKDGKAMMKIEQSLELFPTCKGKIFCGLLRCNIKVCDIIHVGDEERKVYDIANIDKTFTEAPSGEYVQLFTHSL